MSTLIAKANGNFTTASTWGLVDTTSLNTNILTGTNLTTSNTLSSTFTPGAIVVEGIALYIGARLGTIGTMTVGIFQAGTLVTGTDVTINVSDLPNIPSYVVDAGIGWVFFKFASPITLSAATVYSVGARTSSASQVQLRCTSATNWSRALRTATTQAPAASDVLIITGEWTAAATVATRTVTNNNTATTIFGQIDITTNGILTYGTTAATNYYLKVSGNIYVKANGIFRIGTSGTPIPSSSTAVLEFSAAGVATIGLYITSLGTFEAYGASKIPWTMLIVDAASSATSFTVSSTTDWVVGDEVVFAPTARTIAQFERLTTLTIPTATTFTTAASGFSHSGTSPIAGEVGNLTRNVKIRGLTTTTTGFVQIWDSATFSATYVEFSFLGHSSTAGKRGVEFWTTTGTSAVSYSTFHDYAASAIGSYIGTIAATNITLDHNLYYNITTSIGMIAGTTGTLNVLTNNCIIGGAIGFEFTGYTLTCTGNRISGCTTAGMNFLASAVSSVPVFNTNYIHTSNIGIRIADDIKNASFGSSTIWFCTTFGLTFAVDCATDYLLFNSLFIFGCTTASVGLGDISLNGNVYFTSLTSNSHATFPSASAIFLQNSNHSYKNLNFIDSSFGVTVAHTQDVLLSGTAQSVAIKVTFINCLFGSPVEFANQSNIHEDAQISSQRHNQVANVNKAIKKNGTLSNDLAIYNSASMSMRLTPSSASLKLRGGSFKVAVPSGRTLSVSVKVRKSTGTVYNGAQPRLILLTNFIAGITQDTVIATATNAANGAFQSIEGTTATVSDNSILEFVVDCDGTVGWVNVDDFNAVGASMNSLDYYENGQAVALFGSGANMILSRRRKVI